MVIKKALAKLENYIVLNDFTGYDPYDALKSPFFKLPFLKDNKLIRFGAQQFVKRFPLNIRPLLFIPKGLNPVSLGLCIQGYASLVLIDTKKRNLYLDKINLLANQLKTLIPDGFSGTCWGYDFDWEARHFKISEYQPTVVATGIIINGLYHAWRITGKNSLMDIIVNSANFILNDLNKLYDGDSLCFSYSPYDKQRVFNASMKGVRLLAQVYSITQEKNQKIIAKKAVEYVIKNQKENGSWEYSLAKKGDWIDNYHTGYILDCLQDYITLCNDEVYQINLNKGFKYYKETFICLDGRPSFYSDKVYPIDCTAASQSILSLAKFGEIDLAKKVANWMIDNMQGVDGSFYFRKFRSFTNKTSFMRWSNAWMFAAFSYLLMKESGESVI